MATQEIDTRLYEELDDTPVYLNDDKELRSKVNHDISVLEKYYVPGYSSFIQSEDTILKSKVNYDMLLEQKYFGDIPDDVNILTPSQLYLLSKNPSLTFTLSFKEDEFVESYVDVNFTFTNILNYKMNNLINLKSRLLTRSEYKYEEGFIPQDEYIIQNENYCSMQFRLFKENNNMFMEISSFPYSKMETNIFGISSKIILDSILAKYVIDTLLMAITYSSNDYIFVDDWNDIFLLGKPNIITIPDNRIQFNNFLEKLNPDFRKFCEESYEFYIKELISEGYFKKNTTEDKRRKILDETYIFRKYTGKQEDIFQNKLILFTSNIIPRNNYLYMNIEFMQFLNFISTKKYYLEIFLIKLNEDLRKVLHDNIIYEKIEQQIKKFGEIIIRDNNNYLTISGRINDLKSISKFYFVFLKSKYTINLLKENNKDYKIKYGQLKKFYIDYNKLKLKGYEKPFKKKSWISNVYNFIEMKDVIKDDVLIKNIEYDITYYSDKIKEYEKEIKQIKDQVIKERKENDKKIIERKIIQYKLLLDYINEEKETIGLDDVVFVDMNDFIDFINYIDVDMDDFIDFLNYIDVDMDSNLFKKLKRAVFLAEFFEYEKMTYTYYYFYLELLKIFSDTLDNDIINSYANYFKLDGDTFKPFYYKQGYKLKIPYRKETIYKKISYDVNELIEIYKGYRTIENAKSVKEQFDKENVYSDVKDFYYKELTKKANYFEIDQKFFKVFLDTQIEYTKLDIKNQKKKSKFIENYSKLNFRNKVNYELENYKNKIDELQELIERSIYEYTNYKWEFYDQHLESVVIPSKKLIEQEKFDNLYKQFINIRDLFFEIPTFITYFKYKQRIINEIGYNVLTDIYNKINYEHSSTGIVPSKEKEDTSKSIGLNPNDPQLKKLSELKNRINELKTEKKLFRPDSPEYKQKSKELEKEQERLKQEQEEKERIERLKQEEQERLKQERLKQEQEEKEKERQEQIKQDVDFYISHMKTIVNNNKIINEIYDKNLYCHVGIKKEKEVLEEKSEEYIEDTYKKIINDLKDKDKYNDDHVTYFKNNVKLENIKKSFVNFVTDDNSINNYKKNSLQERKKSFDLFNKVKNEGIIQTIIDKTKIVSTDNDYISDVYERLINGENYENIINEINLDNLYSIIEKNLIKISPELKDYIKKDCNNVLRYYFNNIIKDRIFNLYKYTMNFVLNYGRYIVRFLVKDKIYSNEFKYMFENFFKKYINKNKFTDEELGIIQIKNSFTNGNLYNYLNNDFFKFLKRKIKDAKKEKIEEFIEEIKNYLYNDKLYQKSYKYLGEKGFDISKQYAQSLCDFINKNINSLYDNSITGMINYIFNINQSYEKGYKDIIDLASKKFKDQKQIFDEDLSENNDKDLGVLSKKYSIYKIYLNNIDNNINIINDELSDNNYNYKTLKEFNDIYGENIELKNIIDISNIDNNYFLVTNYVLVKILNEIQNFRNYVLNSEQKKNLENNINSIFSTGDKDEKYKLFDKLNIIDYEQNDINNIDFPSGYNYSYNESLDQKIIDELSNKIKPSSQQTGSQAQSQQTGSQALSQQTGSQALSQKSKGQALSQKSKGQTLSQQTGSQALSQKSKGQTLSQQTGSQALSQKSKGQTLSQKSKGQALSQKSKGQTLSQQTGSQAQSQQTGSQAQSQQTGSQALSQQTGSQALSQQTGIFESKKVSSGSKTSSVSSGEQFSKKEKKADGKKDLLLDNQGVFGVLFGLGMKNRDKINYD